MKLKIILIKDQVELKFNNRQIWHCFRVVCFLVYFFYI